MTAYTARLTTWLLVFLAFSAGALDFCARAARPAGDWLDVTGAAVYMALAVGCAHLAPRRRR